ncbi:MAG: hypothetical protein E7527_03705 [Ruminococcaceae bacterium]|nr:hypothetical protein [Oscillospiraceae bacterium]
MKVRIISGLVGIVILAGVLACPYTIVLAIAAALLAAVAVWELLYNTGMVKNLVQVIGGMLVSAAGVMAMYFWKTTQNESVVNYGDAHFALEEQARQWSLVLMALPLVYGLFTLVVWLFNAKKLSLNRACYGFLLTLYPTVGFGSMVLLREIPLLDLWPLLLLFAIAWVSDTGAYFVGTFLGKHKMAPKISPKKSWEGFFGGWVISVAFAVGLFFLRIEINPFNPGGIFKTPLLFVPVVVVLAPLSVVGDLCASVIKRRTGIKDFGNIMPGHGGVMDRFDSVLFIAPLLCYALYNPVVISRILGQVYALF